MEPSTLLTHTDFLRRLTRGLLGDDHQVDDVIQQTWMAALRRPEGTPASRSWLGKVAVNFALRSRRSATRRAAREQRVARSESSHLSPPEILARESAMRAVVEAVFSLDEPYRSTILRRYYDGLTPTRIARLEDISVETVRTRQKRALRRLRAVLDQDSHARDWRAALAPLALARWSTSAGVPATVGSLTGITVIAAMLLGLVTLLFGGGAPAGSVSASVQPATLGAMVPPPFVAASTTVVTQPDPTVPVSNAAVEPPTTGSLTLRVSWAAGDPAAGVQVRVHRATFDRRRVPLLDSLEHVTDTHGMLRLDDLEPGRYRFRTDRGATGMATVRRGEVENAEIRLRKGTLVRGRVVDANGDAFAGAAIHLAFGSDEPGSAIAASSDPKGRFVVRDVPKKAFLGARASGRVASKLRAVHDAPNDLVLTLRGEATMVTGHVIGVDGEPIAGAGVVIGEGGTHRAHRGKDGMRSTEPLPFRTHTDEHGHFHFDGLMASKYPLEVGTPTHAPWRGQASTVEMTITLQPAAYLHGIVRDENGAAVEHARITVALSDDGRYVSELNRLLVAYSDASGAFRMGPAPTGELVATAQASAGKATMQYIAIAGHNIEWNPRLDPGSAIRGILVDESGAALAYWPIEVSRASASGYPARVYRTASESNGRFTIPNLDAGSYRLDFFASPDDADQAHILTLDDVTPGGRDLRIEVPASAMPSARLRGEIVVPRNAPWQPMALMLRGASSPHPLNFQIQQEGSFDVGPVPAGIYEVSIAGRDAGLRRLGHYPVTAGQLVDLGMIRIQTPGHASFVIKRADGRPVDARLPKVLDEHLGHASSLTTRNDQLVTEQVLPPGRYYLEPRQHGHISKLIPFEIESGKTTRVEAYLEKGLQTRIQVEPPVGVSSWRVDVRVYDANRRLVHGFSHLVQSPIQPSMLTFLQPGSYTVEAEAAWNSDANSHAFDTRTFAIEMYPATARPHVLELRPR